MRELFACLSPGIWVAHCKLQNEKCKLPRRQFTLFKFQFAFFNCLHSAGTMAVEVLDRRHMTPGYLVDGNTEHVGDLLALGGAWRPAAQGDRGDAALIQTAA